MNQYLVSKTLCACCMARGIFHRCLNSPHIASLEPDPGKASNQDDATGFIRLNALRLKVAAEVRGNERRKK